MMRILCQRLAAYAVAHREVTNTDDRQINPCITFARMRVLLVRIYASQPARGGISCASSLVKHRTQPMSEMPLTNSRLPAVDMQVLRADNKQIIALVRAADICQVRSGHKNTKLSNCACCKPVSTVTFAQATQ